MARIADNEVLGDLLEEKTGGDVTAEAISQFRKDARDFARDEFTETRRGKRCSRFLSRAADHALRALITSFDTEGLQLCWIATGGYGRGMLSAGSSVRVLLLHGGRDRDAAHALSQKASDILSEAIPASGLSLHTSPDIIGLMHDDAIQASALLETRLLAGSRTAYNRFRSDIEQKFMIPAWGTFGEQVLEESLA
ncbi:MAG: hypothetical protein KGZ25_13225, partial [Planctomycetes bacterium]|nr:hypothetical protein [Planctomycetota bacterium]